MARRVELLEAAEMAFEHHWRRLRCRTRVNRRSDRQRGICAEMLHGGHGRGSMAIARHALRLRDALIFDSGLEHHAG